MSVALVSAGCAAALLVLAACHPRPALAQDGPGRGPQPAGPTQGQPEPLRVITHTREYCDVLGGRVARLRKTAANPPQQADALAGEGELLCAQGQYRAGIGRLRRALVLLRDAGSPPAQ